MVVGNDNGGNRNVDDAVGNNDGGNNNANVAVGNNGGNNGPVRQVGNGNAAGNNANQVVLRSLVRRFTVEPFKEYGKNSFTGPKSLSL